MERITGKYNSGQINGESPIYIPDEDKIIFVDTGNPECIIYNCTDGSAERIRLQKNFQCLARTQSGNWIATTEDGIVLCNKDLSIIKTLESPEKNKPHMIAGDGTAGPDGCFYFGTFNSEDLYAGEGSIYRMNADMSVEKVLTGFALPNGLAFSLDGTKMYVTEMFANAIWVYDFDRKNGTLSNKTLFIKVPEEQGLPDGLIIDSNGYLYSAHWAGYRITRYTPEGHTDKVIRLPVPTPTCMAFGGRNMSTLYVTTARKGLSQEELEKYPESGDLFIIETDYTGRAELKFSG